MRYSPEQARARHANPTKRSEERDSLAETEKRVEKLLADLRTLINEVKELREENAKLLAEAERYQGLAVRRGSRLEQMEEALREARKWCPECGGREYITDPGPPTQQTRQFCPVCRFIRAALSPSDTERPKRLVHEGQHYITGCPNCPSDTEKPRRPRIDPATGRVTR